MKSAIGLVLLGASLLHPIPADADGPVFWGVMKYLASSPAQSLCVADFNGDGISDFALAEGWGGVGVVLNNGDGTLRPETRFLVTEDAESVFYGDFDGDGDQDLVASFLGYDDPDYGYKSPDYVAVLLNDGNGSFSSSPPMVLGEDDSPAGVCTPDLNGDGNADLVVTLSGINQVLVYLSAGDGSFSGGTSYPVGTRPVSVATTDFNGDGNADVVVANSGSANVSVLLGGGDGSLDPALNTPVGSAPSSVCAGDFDEDGTPDIAVANVSSSSISVLIGTGDGTFGPGTDYDVAGVRSVSTADFNADGHLDLGVGGTTSLSVCTLVGDGTGGFSPADCAGFGSPDWWVATGDIDGDGDIDVVAVSPTSVRVSIHRNTGDGSFQVPLTQPAGHGPWAIVETDLDGDGHLDVAMTNRYDDNVSVHLNSGDGTFAPPMYYRCGDEPLSMCSGDFDNDGDRDLAIANYTVTELGTVSVLLNDGSGAFSSPIVYGVLQSPEAICAADLNGDNADDIMVANMRAEQVSVLTNRGDGLFNPAVNYPAGHWPRSILAADLDGDLDVDMAVGNNDGLLVFENLGYGVFAPAVSYQTIDNLDDLCLADFNGDGIVDIAATAPGVVNVFLNDGMGGFATADRYRPYGGYSICSADLDGDSDVDLVACSLGGKEVTMLLNDGTGAFPNTIMYGTASPRDIAAGDLDGDGDVDLVMPSFDIGVASTLWNMKNVAVTVVAEVRITPRTINLSSMGDPLEAMVTLPRGYHAADVEASSLRLNASIPGTIETVVSDREFRARFSRKRLEQVVVGGDADLTVSGTVAGQPFVAVDRVRVIHGGKPHTSPEDNIPSVVGLSHSPNPFNPSARIVFELPRAGDVTIDIFSVDGRLVRRLVSGTYPAGRHNAVWSGRDDNGEEVSSGIYFYRLRTGSAMLTRKMVLIK